MGWVNEAAFSKSYPAKRPLRHENSLLTTSRKEERKRLVPRFVEREFRFFLDCGNYGSALPSASLWIVWQPPPAGFLRQIQSVLPIAWRKSHASSEGELLTILIVLSTQIGH